MAIGYQHVTSTPGVCGGRACIAGTRIRVQDIVIRTELGDSPDDLLCAYPTITLADVYAALAYYHDNRAAMDQEILEDEQYVARVKAQTGPGLLDRLRDANHQHAKVPPG